MASRKQKHALALAKHEKMMADMTASGLKAQQRDREHRAAKQAKLEQEALNRVLEQETQKISKRNAKKVSKIHHAFHDEETGSQIAVSGA